MYTNNKDYPFAAFITNLGKYNEGALVGEWVKFPTTAEELKKVFERIGIGSKDEFGQTYEEWFITDYDCYVSGLDYLGEYESLDELNYLANLIDEMSSSEVEVFEAACELEGVADANEAINVALNVDEYDLIDAYDVESLGEYYALELNAIDIPDSMRYYFDFEAYGRDINIESRGMFVSNGYILDPTDGHFSEDYSGPDDIPDEYRVMEVEEDE